MTVSAPRTRGLTGESGKYLSSAFLSSRTISVMKSSGPYLAVASSAAASPCRRLTFSCWYRDRSRMGSPFES